LRQLIDAALQQFLVGAQIGELVGACHSQPGCKHKCG
jgi:hypothetical protein